MKKIIFILILIIYMLSVIIMLSARYYNPDLGRFVTADTVTPGSGADLQGLNRYSYCLNNPILYIDASGNDPMKFSITDNVRIREEGIINPVTDASIYEHTLLLGSIGFGVQNERDKQLYNPYFEMYFGKSNEARFLFGDGSLDLQSFRLQVFDFYKKGNLKVSEDALTYNFNTGEFNSVTKFSLGLFNKEDVKKLGFNIGLYAEPAVIIKEYEYIISKLKAGLDITTNKSIGPVNIKGKFGLYDIYKANKEGELKPSAASNRLDLTLSMKNTNLFNFSLRNIEGRIKTDFSVDKTGKLQVDKVNPIFNINF